MMGYCVSINHAVMQGRTETGAREGLRLCPFARRKGKVPFFIKKKEGEKSKVGKRRGKKDIKSIINRKLKDSGHFRFPI